ncbi:uncharacterized protein L199_005571 [Kwoniella botswanensis]|uniref:uncharacterized protein n=1 Tax=Kwoniella botswanensis TaxID=1268659 RepID=UPI00315DE625
MPPVVGSHDHHQHEGKDESPRNGNHQHGRRRAPGQPLRRGDACLMCRAKKLRCSAQKPVCDQCAKRKDRCVYDAVRPASRVEKLEKKLAEMDAEDFREAMRRTAFKNYGRSDFENLAESLASPPSSNTIGQDNGIPNFSGFNLIGSSQSSHSKDPNGQAETLSPTSFDQMLNHDSELLVDINDMPLSAWPWPQSGTSSILNFNHNGHQTMFQPSQLQQTRLPDSTLPWHLIGSSNNLSFTNPSDSPPINGLFDFSDPSTANGSAASSRAQSHDSTSSPTPPHFLKSNTSPPVRGLNNLNINLRNGHDSSVAIDGLSTVIPHAMLPAHDHIQSGVLSNHGLGISLPNGFGSNFGTSLPESQEITPASEVIRSVLQVKRAVTAENKSIRAKELSDGARDYLLDLFFSTDPPRPLYGSEFFTEEEFRSRLALQGEDRPHPSLVFSMCTIAASESYVPSIRKLAEPLFKIATSKLEIAIRQEDRLISAIRASKNLSKWLFAQGRVFEGYQYSCKTISLCIACGLHQIPSSIFTRAPESQMAQDEKARYLLEPPKSQGELAERIHAFWSAWGNDKGGCLTHHWSSTIRDEEIITPLPRPSEDFLSDALLKEPDMTLRDLYDLAYRDNASPPKSIYGYILAAEHLIYRAMNILSQPPEAMLSSYRSLGLFGQSQVWTPREHYPTAYKEIMETSLWLEEKIPEDWRMKFLITGKWGEPDIPIVALCLKTARMHLHPLESDFDRPIGLCLAFDSAQLIKTLQVYYKNVVTSPDPTSPTQPCTLNQTNTGHSTFSGINNQIPDSKDNSRNRGGISGPYGMSPCYGVVQKLVEGSIILEKIGQMEESRKCMQEVTILLDGFRGLAVHCKIIAAYVERLEKLLPN